MFQKKPIFIIGIVVFTLLLIADLVLYFLIPAGFGRGDMGGFGIGRPSGGFASGNSGFDSLEGSDTDDSGISAFEGFGGGGFKDQGGFGGMRPNGEKGDFTMPEGMEKPDGMEPPDGMDAPGNMEPPEGFDPSGVPSRGQMGGAMAIFNTVRSAFWPVLTVCVIGDGLCIFMLVRISRKKKAAAIQAQAASAVPAELPPATGKDE